MATTTFKDSALSFAGCDGGNISSEIWFCGLEWGGEQKNEIDPPIDRENLYSWLHPDFDGAWIAQYNQKICWFLWYFYNLEWNNGENAEIFVKRHHILYPETNKGIGFKINMLPIGFPNRENIDWNSDLIKLTGFNSFDEYRQWCIEYRGKFFQNVIKEEQPKLIVCTGIGEAERFAQFFMGSNALTWKNTDKYKMAYTKFENTLICIVPFFGGANGINSYDKMENVVLDIKNLLNE